MIGGAFPGVGGSPMGMWALALALFQFFQVGLQVDSELVVVALAVGHSSVLLLRR